MEKIKKKWLEAFGKPSDNSSRGKTRLVNKFSCKEFDAELYVQETGCEKSNV